MGEYSDVVWGAYLVAAVILLGCLIVSLRALRRAKATLKDLES